MYVCMYLRTYVRTYVRMYVCMYACTYVCMHACIRQENNNYAKITYVFWLHILRFFGPYLKYHTTEKEADSSEYAIYQLSMEKN